MNYFKNYTTRFYHVVHCWKTGGPIINISWDISWEFIFDLWEIFKVDNFVIDNIEFQFLNLHKKKKLSA